MQAPQGEVWAQALLRGRPAVRRGRVRRAPDDRNLGLHVDVHDLRDIFHNVLDDPATERLYATLHGGFAVRQ